MKRGLAIPCGLLLFGLAVASLFHSRPAASPNSVAKAFTVEPSTIEVAKNDDYLPPLFGICDESELATPGPFGSLATVAFDQPTPLPLEVLRQAIWPSARPEIMLTGGYDNPVPTPFSATPKPGGQVTGGSTTIIPDLFDNQPPLSLVGPASAPPIISRPTDSLIRPKPLALDNPGSMVRLQGEPPLAGSQPIPAPLTPTPVLAAPQVIHPVPANLTEFTGCGCEPRIGPACGCCGRTAHGCCSAPQVPLCCQTFARCCQPPVYSYQVINCSNCCSGEGHWRPFAKLKSWFRKDQKSCGSCFEDCCSDSCGSARKPLFAKFHGLFHKSRCDDCIFAEPCEMGCGNGSVIMQ